MISVTSNVVARGLREGAASLSEEFFEIMGTDFVDVLQCLFRGCVREVAAPTASSAGSRRATRGLPRASSSGSDHNFETVGFHDRTVRRRDGLPFQSRDVCRHRRGPKLRQLPRAVLAKSGWDVLVYSRPVRSRSVGPALAVLFLVNVLNFYDRQTLAAILEPLRHEFSLSDTQLGGLFTLFTVVFALAGLPLGQAGRHAQQARAAGRRNRGLDRADRSWRGWPTSYAVLLGTRLGVGIGEAVCTPAATSWIGDLVPASHRARAMAGFMMAVPVGIMLSSAISGPVAQAHGWRMAMVLAAVPGPGADSGGAVAARAGAAGGALADAGGAALPARPLVDRGFGGGGQFRALQLFDLSAGVFDAVSRDERGAGGDLDGDRVGSLGDSGGGGGGVAGRSGEESLVAGGGGIAAGGGSGVRGAADAGGQRGGRGVAGDGGLWLAADVLRAGVRGDSGCGGAGMRGRAMAVYFVATYLGGASWGPLLTGRLSDFLARRSGLGGGGIARGGIARCDVRDSGAGGGAGGGALGGGTGGKPNGYDASRSRPSLTSVEETRRTFPAVHPSLQRSSRAY